MGGGGTRQVVQLVVLPLASTADITGSDGKMIWIFGHANPYPYPNIRRTIVKRRELVESVGILIWLILAVFAPIFTRNNIAMRINALHTT